jgi:hypothetical protein
MVANGMFRRRICQCFRTNICRLAGLSGHHFRQQHVFNGQTAGDGISELPEDERV